MDDSAIGRVPHTVFNTTSAVAVIFDDGRLVSVNEAFERTLGYTIADLENARNWPFLARNHQEQVLSVVGRAASREVTEPFDTPVVCSDGTIKTMRWSTMRINDGPQQSSVVLFGLKVSGSLRHEKDDRRFEDNFSGLAAVFQHSREMVSLTDLDGNIIFLNAVGSKMLGIDPLDVGKTHMMQVVPDHLKTLVTKELVPALLSGGSWEGDLQYRNLRTEGLIDAHTVAFTIDDPQTGRHKYLANLSLDISQRKQTEEKFAKVFMMAPECMAITRMSDGLIVDTNMGFEEILGWKQSEAVGRTSQEIGFWVDPAERVFMVNELQAGRFVVNREFLFRRKDGTVRNAIYSARPIRIRDDLHLIFAMRDITQLKEAERMLQESEERVRSITNNMPGAICQFYAKDTGERGMSYASGRLTELFGLPKEMDSVLPAPLPYIYEEDRERLLASIHDAVQSFSAWSFEGRFVKPSGEVIWFHGGATPRRLADRVVFDGILLDITDRKLAEKKIRETEVVYSTLVNSLPDAVAITDRENRVTFVSPQAATLYGIDAPESMLGRSILDIVAPESREHVIRNRKELLEGATLPPQEYILIRGDGGRFYAEVYHSVIRDAAGDIKAVISVTRDISRRKHLEEEHRKLEEELFQSQKMDAIGQLAGGVAHDFNNILMGIQGNASLMLMEHHPQHPHYHRLSQIEEHVKRGANLTRQLLGFARGGKYEVKILSVNDLVRKMAGFFAETRKEIEVGFELDEQLHTIEADAGQIEQVLLNIFINAGHAMPQGGRLRIETSNVLFHETDARAFETRPGNYVKISVSDTGIGMDGEVLKRIFEPFFTTKAEQGGTGLGLASAYGIIDNHGGVIRAYSEPGKGSIFNIYLPSSEKTAEKTDRLKDANLLSGTGGILLVDDEPMILGAASEILQLLGYTVYRAESGQEAVDIYADKQKNIDLVILDMILPGMSGSQVLKTLREMNPDVRVVLSSGYGLQGEVQKVMESGCRDFIQKPYVFAELSQVVKRALTGTTPGSK